MSDLTFLEKRKLERQLQMDGGYVLDFSNRTFAEFVRECVSRDIHDSRYDFASGSKANRLRAFWKEEPNSVVAALLLALLDHCKTLNADAAAQPLFGECLQIAHRLHKDAPVESIDALVTEDTSDRGFEFLAQAIRASVERNEPEAGLDRLHTYVTRLIRTVAKARGIQITRDKPLHSVFGEYVKRLRAAGLIESGMTERILKSSIGTMEAFNEVRNERSLAHDNPVLSYDESLLIINHVCSAVRFVRALEARAAREAARNAAARDDGNSPF